jgi:hypothetical protein
MMNLSSSFDHCFVDGYDAAAVIQSIKQMLEHPATIFLPTVKKGETMKLKYIGQALLLFALAASTGAIADELERPRFHAAQSMMVEASVEAINHETREVTLKRPDGEIIEFVASDEARNLDQVSVGDIVTAEYVESLSIEVIANEGYEPEAGEMQAMARTEKGQMPGVTAIDVQVATATVEDINIEANTFKLRGPDGSVEEYVARNPENLKRAKVGDLVVFTATTSVTIVVDAAPKE